ncbi:TRAP transporter large permease [Ferrovibrio sp.]|uniref:TRAP transporter large permease n=1 Tax=Ferrovibrio sp. TaxID=1917215 RepID=UPI00311F0DDC
MSPAEIGVVMIAAMLALMVLRAPIFLSMALVGAAGYVWLVGPAPLLNYLKGSLGSLFVSYDLSVVPLFLLMGNFAARAGISQELFAACNAWVGHRRGGLAISTILGCAGFGAICGSSLATASAMARFALPEMRRHGYSGALSAGTLAAGGTLGILIPPSVVLIIYAILTEQNVVKLFLAATIPGLIAVAGFILAVMIYVRLVPGAAGPVTERKPLRQRLLALRDVSHVVAIFAIVLGGIYGGLFTPTEGAAVGAVITGIVAVIFGGLRWRGFIDAALETAAATAMICAIVFGADLFNVALALTRVPMQMADWIGEAGIAPYAVLLVIILIYLVLGCVMDSLSMILLTVPIIFPAFMALDFGLLAEQQALWFGILTLIVVELGMITPPVGLNLFIISLLAKDIPTRDIFVGVIPFLCSEAVRVVLIAAFPVLSYWLVGIVFG